MSDMKKPYVETVVRYCHVIGKNRTVSRSLGSDGECFACSHRKECEKNGGCKNPSMKKEGS